MARDRFEDCTYVFESHHHDYARVRKIIAKYEVPEEVAAQTERRVLRRARPCGEHDTSLSSRDATTTPMLLGDEAFYSVIRQRVSKYLKEIGHAEGGPTWGCIALFWSLLAAHFGMGWVTWYTGSFLAAGAWGFVQSFLGAFGHNWVHQPKYHAWGWDVLSLDMVGFSSQGWYREHVLQHHMYTNTPWDHHFKGTEPWLVCDSRVQRSWLQRYVMPYLTPVLLAFGMYANYIGNIVQILLGVEPFDWTFVFKLLLPLQFAAILPAWGLGHGLALMFTTHGILSVYYYSLALMNHNAEHCCNVEARNKSRDWGEAQLNVSADWAVNSSFLSAIVWLWLNYHTVHHLLPRTDFSHHPAIQSILFEACREFGVTYITSNPVSIYREMISSFASPKSLFKEIHIYGGGI
jgi:linoleoyl-CoA desaturase